jgi:hypothetical protein
MITPEQLEQLNELATPFAAEFALNAVHENNGLVVAHYIRSRFGDPVLRAIAELYDPQSRIEKRNIKYGYSRRGRPRDPSEVGKDVRAVGLSLLVEEALKSDTKTTNGRKKKAISVGAKKAGNSVHTVKKAHARANEQGKSLHRRNKIKLKQIPD